MSKHLIIRSLHRDESFLAMGIDHLLEKLTSLNQDFKVRSLYDIKFNPVLTTSDFQALKAGNLPEDIAKEQEMISQAGYLWVIFPIWWSGMPAILKGYIDRVFLSGFAYRMEHDSPVGLLTGKKVIILNSMGMSREEYEETGMYDALALTIDKGIFEFSGMKVIAHRYFTSIMSASSGERQKYLDEIVELAEDIVTAGMNPQDLVKNKFIAVK